jgi:hypothetical protein
MIDIKLPNEKKMKNWIFHINQTLEEIKFSYDAKSKEIEILNKSRKTNEELIYFGMELNIIEAKIDLFSDKNLFNKDLHRKFSYDISSNVDFKKLDKIFEFGAKNLSLILNMRDFDIFLRLRIYELFLFEFISDNKLNTNKDTIGDSKKAKLMLRSIKNENEEIIFNNDNDNYNDENSEFNDDYEIDNLNDYDYDYNNIYSEKEKEKEKLNKHDNMSFEDADYTVECEEFNVEPEGKIFKVI